MARVDSPPPKSPPKSPIIHLWQKGRLLRRIYNPNNHKAKARRFRTEGPFVRFDHHITGSDRGILYAADSLAGALAEIYGDTAGGPTDEYRYCALVPIRDLKLLDLRGNGAFAAGTIIAVTATSHPLAQQWSRYFYDNVPIYGHIDGILYPNAHNGDVAVALYELAEDGIESRPAFDRRLDSKTHRQELLDAIRETGLDVYIGA